MNGDEALENLGRIKHIVVLMMENRSFDQMLGFLEADGLEVEGIGHGKANLDRDGNEYPPFEWGPGETAQRPPPGMKAKILDPCHSPDCVKTQLEHENGGFVKNFAATRRNENDEEVALTPEFLRVPMGHFGAEHLPVYRFLAHNFCVCDHWHSSIPGDTWPNRLYSLAGTDGTRVGHDPSLLEKAEGALGALLGKHPNLPIFEVDAFTHQLEDSKWRWYSHDPATLRAADKHYRDFRHLNRDNFAFFDRKKVSFLTEGLNLAIVGGDSFLDDAANDKLREVSWIDPNFIDLDILDPSSNDDHPPSDVRAGQALVLETYRALAASKDWEDTLLVIVYDEHGGFYDHVAPPAVDDGSGYPTLGLRVPALVIGPRVRKGVSHQRFEHTTLIATILRRFAADPAAALAAMPERVRGAPHLGGLLQAEPRTDIESIDEVKKKMAEWRIKARDERRGAADGKAPAPDGAGHELDLHDFQREFTELVVALRKHGLPPGQP